MVRGGGHLLVAEWSWLSPVVAGVDSNSPPWSRHCRTWCVSIVDKIFLLPWDVSVSEDVVLRERGEILQN